MKEAGDWAPILAVVLAVLLGVAAFASYAESRGRAVAQWKAEATAAAIAEADEAEAIILATGSTDDVRVVEAVPASKRYPFLRSYEYLVHPEAPGGRLKPTQPEDKATADDFARATAGPVSRGILGGHRAARALGETRAVVVEVRRSAVPSGLMAALLLGIVGLLGALLWRRLMRGDGGRAAAIGSAVTGLGLSGAVLYLLREVEAPLEALVGASGPALKAALAAPLPEGAGLVVALTITPIVVFGVSGWMLESRRSPHRAAYLYVTPAMLGMAVLILVPFAIGVLLAFMRHDNGTFTWVGLQNFISILKSEGYGLTHPLSFWFTLVVTVLWTALNVLFHAGIGLGLALLLNTPDLRFRGVYRVLLIVPWAVPNYITALVWKGMFNKQYGLINYVLGGFGVEPVGWFSSFWTAFSANVTTNTWLGFPFMMVVALGALQSIPKDLYEAAEVDGATKWQQFKAITLPLLRPAMFPAIILGSIWTFNMFNIIYLVSAGQPRNSTDILIVEAYRWAFEQDRYGYAAAYSMLIFLILLGYSLLTARISKGAEEAYG